MQMRLLGCQGQGLWSRKRREDDNDLKNFCEEFLDPLDPKESFLVYGYDNSGVSWIMGLTNKRNIRINICIDLIES